MCDVVCYAKLFSYFRYIFAVLFNICFNYLMTQTGTFPATGTLSGIPAIPVHSRGGLVGDSAHLIHIFPPSQLSSMPPTLRSGDNAAPATGRKRAPSSVSNRGAKKKPRTGDETSKGQGKRKGARYAVFSFYVA